MNSLKRITVFISIICLILFLVGCKSLGSFDDEGLEAGDALENISVLFNLNFSTLLKGAEPSGSNSSAVFNQSRSMDIPSYAFDSATGTYFRGTVTFERIPSGVTKSFDVIAGIDSSWDAILDQALVLQAGTYNISLLFSDSNQEYMGTASSVAISVSGPNIISIDVHPVIGDTVTSTAIADTIAMFNLDYPDLNPHDLDISTWLNPSMVVTVDSTGDVELLLNEFTGNSRVFFNLDGTHDIELQLRENGVTIARFSNSVNFTSGTDITLNLTPVFGIATFALTEAGGDATFDFKLPASVITQLNSEVVGNIDDADYHVLLRMTGNNNADVTIDTLAFTEDATGDYWSTVTFSDFQYDTLNFIMEIWDDTTVPDELIAECSFTVDVTRDARNTNCDFILHKRAEITGNILHVLGVNVVDATGDAVLGARVYVDGFERGTTGDGTSDGFLVVYLEPGEHVIHATSPSGDASSDYEPITAVPWGTGNLFLQLF